MARRSITILGWEFSVGRPVPTRVKICTELSLALISDSPEAAAVTASNHTIAAVRKIAWELSKKES